MAFRVLHLLYQNHSFWFLISSVICMFLISQKTLWPTYSTICLAVYQLVLLAVCSLGFLSGRRSAEESTSGKPIFRLFNRETVDDIPTTLPRQLTPRRQNVRMFYHNIIFVNWVIRRVFVLEISQCAMVPDSAHNPDQLNPNHITASSFCRVYLNVLPSISRSWKWRLTPVGCDSLSLSESFQGNVMLSSSASHWRCHNPLKRSVHRILDGLNLQQYPMA